MARLRARSSTGSAQRTTSTSSRRCAGVKSAESFSLIHQRTIHKFDTFPANTEFEREQLKRAQRIRVELFGTELDVSVATPDDVVLAKVALVPTGWRGVGAAMAGHSGRPGDPAGQLDVEYLNYWRGNWASAYLLASL